jgi:F420-0:gamma-glutamyl ligase-like protein
VQKACGVKQGIIEEVGVHTAFRPLARLTIDRDLVNVPGEGGREGGREGERLEEAKLGRRRRKKREGEREGGREGATYPSRTRRRLGA